MFVCSAAAKRQAHQETHRGGSLLHKCSPAPSLLPSPLDRVASLSLSVALPGLLAYSPRRHWALGLILHSTHSFPLLNASTAPRRGRRRRPSRRSARPGRVGDLASYARASDSGGGRGRRAHSFLPGARGSNGIGGPESARKACGGQSSAGAGPCDRAVAATEVGALPVRDDSSCPAFSPSTRTHLRDNFFSFRAFRVRSTRTSIEHAGSRATASASSPSTHTRSSLSSPPDRMTARSGSGTSTLARRSASWRGTATTSSGSRSTRPADASPLQQGTTTSGSGTSTPVPVSTRSRDPRRPCSRWLGTFPARSLPQGRLIDASTCGTPLPAPSDADSRDT